MPKKSLDSLASSEKRLLEEERINADRIARIKSYIASGGSAIRPELEEEFRRLDFFDS